MYVGDKQILEVASDLCQVLGYFENAVINFSIQKQNDVFNTSHIGIPFAKYPKKISNILYLHNPIIHLFDPQKNLHTLGIVLDFSWDIFMSQEKL